MRNTRLRLSVRRTGAGSFHSCCTSDTVPSVPILAVSWSRLLQAPLRSIVRVTSTATKAMYVRTVDLCRVPHVPVVQYVEVLRIIRCRPSIAAFLLWQDRSFGKQSTVNKRIVDCDGSESPTCGKLGMSDTGSIMQFSLCSHSHFPSATTVLVASTRIGRATRLHRL